MIMGRFDGAYIKDENELLKLLDILKLRGVRAKLATQAEVAKDYSLQVVAFSYRKVLVKY
jgi:hypothetical protein